MQITPNSHQQLGRGQAKLFIVHLLFTYIYWQTIPGHIGIIRNQPGRNQPEKFNTVWRFVRFPGQNLVTFPCSSSRHTLPHPSSTKFFLSFFLSKDTYCPLKASHTAVPFIPPQHFFPHSSPILSFRFWLSYCSDEQCKQNISNSHVLHSGISMTKQKAVWKYS